MENNAIDHSVDPKIGFKLTGFQKNSIFVICFLLYMVNNMDRQVLSVVIEPMKADLGLSDAQAGFLHTVFFLSMALLSFPIAFVVDRWSRRKSLALMAIVWSVFTFVTGLGRSFTTVLLPRIAVGIGEAGFPPAGTALLSAAYSEKIRGRILGLFNASIPLGIALGMMIGGQLCEKSGSWRTPFYIFTIPGIILGIMAYFLKDYKTVKSIDEKGQQKSFYQDVKTLFKIPTLRWMYFGYAAHLAMVMGFLVWIPALTMRTQGLTIGKAGMFAGLIGLMAVFGAPLGGIWGDIWQSRSDKGRTYVMTIAPIVAGITICISVYLDMKGIGYLVALLSGVFLVVCTPAANSVSQDVVAPANKAIAWAMAGFFGLFFGASWAPSAVGAVSDMLGGGASGLKTAVMLLSPLGLIASICFGNCTKYYPGDMDKVKGYTLEAE